MKHLLLAFALFTQQFVIAQITIQNNGLIYIEPDGTLVVIPDSADPIQKIGNMGGIRTASETAQVIVYTSDLVGDFRIPFVASNGRTIPLQYQIQQAGTADGNVVFSSWETDPDNTMIPVATAAVPAPNQTVDRFWKIETANYTQAPTVALQFAYDSLDVALNSIMESELTALQWNETLSEWQWSANTTQADTANRIVTVAADAPISEYMFWALAERAVGLPIQLLSFATDCAASAIRWATATEINNKHFIIQGTQDGVEYQDVQIINAVGNSSQTRYYEYLMTEWTYNYYRLCQTDWDGTARCFALKPGCPSETTLKLLYPNPNDGRFILQHQLQYQFEIFNVLGQSIWKETSNRNVFDLRDLAAGQYTLQLTSETGIHYHFKFSKF
jgi:hypothetical protein